MAETIPAPPKGLYDDGTYLMPPFFGGLPYPLPPAVYRDTTNLALSYLTDERALARLLPPGFTLLEPRILISIINNRGVEWLAGGAYNLLAVNVPVRFEGAKDQLEGVFGLVVWENRTAPILMGREVQGVPKLFANVDDLREFPEGYHHSTAHLDGCRFAKISAQLGGELGAEDLDAIRAEVAEINWFGWRHIPKVGAPGPALSHPVLFPQEFDIWSARKGSGLIEWFEPDWMSNPTQTSVIASLAALPVLEAGEAVLMRCKNVLRADLARVPS